MFNTNPTSTQIENAIAKLTRAEVVEELRETDPPNDTMAKYERSSERDQREALSNLWHDAAEAERDNALELLAYENNMFIRVATDDEAQASIDASRLDGGAGVIIVAGVRCYVL